MKERTKTKHENKIETTNRKKRTNIHKIMKDTNRHKNNSNKKKRKQKETTERKKQRKT